jgi:hypothetical protein
MVKLVISGGQTGVDQAAWRAAKACGIPTGGKMPLGYLTEDGPRPDFAALYGAVEMPTVDYPARTRANVQDADATLWFGDAASRGGLCTAKACRDSGKPMLTITRGLRPSQIASVIRAKGWQVLNIAGSRESNDLGIGQRVERFLADLFRRL